METGDKRGVAILHPMNLGEILDRAFEIYRKRVWLFVGIAALPAVVMLGLQTADHAWVHTDRLLGTLDRGGAFVWGQVVWFGYFHISAFLGMLFLPAFVHASSKILFGKNTTIMGSLGFALARWRAYAWIAILKLAAQLVMPEVLAVGSIFGGVAILEMTGHLDTSGFFPMGAVILIPLAGFVFLFLWIGASIAFSIPVAALEGLGGVKALRRSWLLTRGSRWRVFLTWAAIFAGVWAAAAVVVVLLRFTRYILHDDWHLLWFNQRVYTQLSHISYAAINALIGPIYPIAITLLYYDQRVRKEGYDLEKMMEAAGLVDAPDKASAGAITAGIGEA